MKTVIFRSIPVDDTREERDRYIQEFDTLYAERVIGNIRNNPEFCVSCQSDCNGCRSGYKPDHNASLAAVYDMPSRLPYVLENPETYLPASAPEHDVLMAICIHEQILLELLKRCEKWGVRGVVVPLEAPDWLSGSARKKASDICESHGIEIAFPKSFCGFNPPAGSLLADFRKHFKIGKPDVTLKTTNGIITEAKVNISAPCGATCYIARWLIGRSVHDDLEIEVLSKRLHSYPCTASMKRDPELGGETPLHVAGEAHREMLDQLPDRFARDRKTLQPLPIKTTTGKIIHPAGPIKDNSRQIATARQSILNILADSRRVNIQEIRNSIDMNPATISTTLLLLKQENIISIDKQGTAVFVSLK